MAVIDKRAWGHGPWLTEPDEARWVDEPTGLACLIKRNQLLGNLCGYVGVEEGHPLFGLSYSDRVAIPPGFERRRIDDTASVFELFIEATREEEDDGTVSIGLALQVHGGCTFGGRWDNDGPWWFGFDCGHAWDVCPGLDKRMQELTQEMRKRVLAMPGGDDPLRVTPKWGAYRTFDYVKHEVEALAVQLATWRPR